MDIHLRRNGEEECFKHWAIGQVELIDFKNAEKVHETWLSFDELRGLIDSLALNEEVQNCQLLPVTQGSMGTSGPLGIFLVSLLKENGAVQEIEQWQGKYLFVDKVALVREILQQIWEMYHSESNLEIMLR